MSSTVADQLLERLSQWGEARLRLPRRWHQRDHGRHGPARRGIRLYPRAPRGDGGLHGRRPRQVYRRGRVCLATSGPGAIHLLNGLYDARMDHQPVLAIVGQQAATALGSDYQQEVDLQSLFKDVSAYVETVVSPAQLLHVLDRAPARGGRRAAGGDGDRAQRRATDGGPEAPAPRARPRDVGGGLRPAATLRARRRPGSRRGDPQSRPARGDPRRCRGPGRAPATGSGRRAPGRRSGQGAPGQGGGFRRPAVRDRLHRPARHPRQQHADGALRHPADRRQHFPYSEFLPKAGQARAVQIDLYPRNIGIRYPIDQALLGDAGETLERLLPLLEQKSTVPGAAGSSGR